MIAARTLLSQDIIVPATEAVFDCVHASSASNMIPLLGWWCRTQLKLAEHAESQEAIGGGGRT